MEYLIYFMAYVPVFQRECSLYFKGSPLHCALVKLLQFFCKISFTFWCTNIRKLFESAFKLIRFLKQSLYLASPINLSFTFRSGPVNLQAKRRFW